MILVGFWSGKIYGLVGNIHITTENDLFLFLGDEELHVVDESIHVVCFVINPLQVGPTIRKVAMDQIMVFEFEG